MVFFGGGVGVYRSGSCGLNTYVCAHVRTGGRDGAMARLRTARAGDRSEIRMNGRTEASRPPGTRRRSSKSSIMMRRAVVETARAMARATSRTVTMSSETSSLSRARSMVTAVATRADGETGTREGGAGETVGRETATRRRPRAMEVTPSASRRIKELLRARNKEYLKIGVKTRGCNGMTYTMNYAEEGERKKFDELVETDDGVKIIVEPNALMSIIGTKMDYVSDRLRSEFVFENPNAKAECGCGESFTV